MIKKQLLVLLAGFMFSSVASAEIFAVRCATPEAKANYDKCVKEGDRMCLERHAGDPQAQQACMGNQHKYCGMRYCKVIILGVSDVIVTDDSAATETDSAPVVSAE
jgi:hypothetical protein